MQVGSDWQECFCKLHITASGDMESNERNHSHASSCIVFFFKNGILVKLRDSLENTFFWGGLGGAPTGYRPALGGDTLELQEIVHGAMGF